MAHKSFSYKGHDVWLAAFQPNKARRGGHTRSVQVRKDFCIVKQFRYDTHDPYGFSKASKKACEWIDGLMVNIQNNFYGISDNN